MAKKTRKLEEKARRFLERGRYDKAVEKWQELVELEPQNPRWLHKLGESYSRMGQAADAIEAYSEAAQLNAGKGYLLKAIAQCKMVLDLDPGHGEIQGMLASLYAQRRSGRALGGARAPTTGSPPSSVAPWEVSAEAVPAAAEADQADEPDEDQPDAYRSAELPPAEEAGHEPAQSAADELRDAVPSTTGVGELDYEERPAGSRVEEAEWIAASREADSGEFQRPDAISLVLEAPPAPDDSGGFGGEEVQDLYDPGLRDIPDTPDWSSKSLASMSTPPDLGPGDTLDSIELHKLMDELEDEIEEAGESVVLEIDLGGDGEDEEPVEPAREREDPASATQILEQMPAVPLFSSLDEGALRMIIERVGVRMFDEGDWIVRQGQPGQSLFVIVEGSVRVYREGAPRVELGTLGEGAFFGETALITDQERQATVEADTEGMALEVSRELIGEVVATYPDVLKQLLRFFRMRMIDLLVETHELFEPFAGEDRGKLERQFTFIEATAGAPLLTEGELSDGLYILVSGKAEARHEGEWMGELHAGDMVGEPSLLTGRPSAVTVVSSSKCWLLKLDRAFFQETVMTHPEVLRLVGKLAEDRKEKQQAAERGEGFEAFTLTLY